MQPAVKEEIQKLPLRPLWLRRVRATPPFSAGR